MSASEMASRVFATRASPSAPESSTPAVSINMTDEAGNLVASFHEVGSRSGNVRNDSYILACQGVDQGTFSTVAAT